jgi:hypothetical protein
MEHVVFYSEDSGQSEFRRVGDLEAAVRLVETLRNERGIADVTVHALTPVPVSFKTYYRVEIAADQPGPSDDGPDPDPTDDVPALAVPLLADEPRRTPVLLAVPSLLDEPAVDEVVPDLDADESATEVSYGTLTSLNYEPLADVEPLVGFEPLDVDEAPEFELSESSELSEGFEAAESPEPGEDFELVVPQSRPEPEAERSLGYFAR